ncbi:dephospho-CoA kinase [Tepidamorphus gemmatus]|uniref:Dephospho-CoA kinase n=1 Tax=Tepidamorphus gemmatus TaxID=747076 RepID=A0A4R3MFG7_9HYPH|nr:dephospho-CoA kinase [Tepidamorphus gemmatus]TCT11902.1 dephospho-CoA kinase [Tepidamorphus gemmatus]
MFLIGLTGSIGMGKSATGRMFASRGIPVHDADAQVHELYQAEAVAPIREAFPAAVVETGVDRERLSQIVVGDRAALRRLEAIVHPLVRARERRFLDRCFAAGHRHVVLEVPLLFETGGDRRVDAVVVTSAPADVQRRRVLARGGMTEAKLEAILARQLPDRDKRRRAHFIVDTGRSFAFAEKQVDDILRAIAACPGNAYRRGAPISDG